jgi:hypothetical protein
MFQNLRKRISQPKAVESEPQRKSLPYKITTLSKPDGSSSIFVEIKGVKLDLATILPLPPEYTYEIVDGARSDVSEDKKIRISRIDIADQNLFTILHEVSHVYIGVDDYFAHSESYGQQYDRILKETKSEAQIDQLVDLRKRQAILIEENERKAWLRALELAKELRDKYEIDIRKYYHNFASFWEDMSGSYRYYGATFIEHVRLPDMSEEKLNAYSEFIYSLFDTTPLQQAAETFWHS